MSVRNSQRIPWGCFCRWANIVNCYRSDPTTYKLQYAISGMLVFHYILSLLSRMTYTRRVLRPFREWGKYHRTLILPMILTPNPMKRRVALYSHIIQAEITSARPLVHLFFHTGLPGAYLPFLTGCRRHHHVSVKSLLAFCRSHHFRTWRTSSWPSGVN